ncbi:putative mannan endo-1,6-alpha-mannosidase precursor [Podospora australis]|uniref:Mannan endo-1,6-alpha-mannosidase n=1 Tax=Podospora australis TaxID=1536484 RepID=A0AAN7ADZ9_9PEZI|nr:putative mannan endo-1,6-alpha-mannosidase precursor [Podospora australis]
MKIRLRCALLLALAVNDSSAALRVDFSSADSIRSAAKTVASNLMTYYHGTERGQIPGILPGPPPKGPYYWWEGGALWGTMIDYWHYTTDTTYNTETELSLVFQANSPQNDYMHPNWTASLGNDDQGFWGMSAMLAAETTFQNPPPDQPQWLALAQAVFNTQASRWDTDYCRGGLRWQIPLSNNGYNYKNSIANAVFFNIATRLARYTGNDTYAEWAAKTWDWMSIEKGVGYIDADYNVFDGAHVEDNCTDINLAQFSYTAVILIQGLGFLHNHTNGQQPIWSTRLRLLTNKTLSLFFSNGTAVEPSCELENAIQCTTDMLSFKGYVHRWLAQTTQMAPFLEPIIMPILKTSAQSMAQSCLEDGTCGFRWNRGAYDGNTGAGQQMNALGALVSMLVHEPGVKVAVTNGTGGTSPGDPNAGSNTHFEGQFEMDNTLTNGDRVGAGIVTTIVLASLLGAFGWMASCAGEVDNWPEGRGVEKGKGSEKLK